MTGRAPDRTPESGRPAGATTAAPRRRRRGWRLLVQVALTVGVTWIIVAQVGVSLDEALALELAVPDPSVGWLAASIVALAVAMAATARMWGWMVAELGGADPGLKGSLRIVLTANLGRYLPGKVWQLAGLAVLSRRSGIAGSVGTAAGALGQGFHLAGAAVVGLWALAGRGELTGGAVWLGVGVLALFVAVASVPGIVHSGMRVTFRLAGIREEPPPRPGLLFGPRWVLLHTLVWMLYGAAFVLLVRGLGFDTTGGAYLAAAFSAAYLLGYLALFAPAGIGVREGVLIALVRPVLGTSAVGIAVLARVWITVVELVPAGMVALWEIFRRRGEAGVDRGGGNGDG